MQSLPEHFSDVLPAIPIKSPIKTFETHVVISNSLWNTNKHKSFTLKNKQKPKNKQLQQQQVIDP